MDQVFQGFMDRVRMMLAAGSGQLPEMPRWLENNTANPLNTDEKWSFKNHEFQIGIIASPARRKSVQKCSQVGLTEIALRVAIAVAAMLNDIRVIYTGPTSNFITKLVKDRANSIINTSQMLNSLVDPDVNTVEQKKIGRSFVYFSGAFKPSNAISIPATFLLNDEVDFSNPVVLSMFSSRLRHAANRGYHWKFSTPTGQGIGINQSFQAGTQAYYSVMCPCCHKRQVLDFLRDVVIPGFDQAMNLFSRDALLLPRLRLDKAFVRCPSCHGVITPEAFLDPTHREWVRKYPDREEDSFQVFPWDAYAYNPLDYVLQQVKEYKRVADYFNNVIGIPFDDATNSILGDAMQPHPNVGFTLPEEGAGGCFSGCDIGKISWYTVLKPNPLTGTDDLIYAERISETGDNAVLRRALFLNQRFGVIFSIMDAAPDYNTSLSYTQQGGYEQNWKAVYVVRKSKGMIGCFKKLPEEQNTINIWRTGAFDDLARAVNKRLLRFFSGNPEELELVQKHLGAMRRQETESEVGEPVATWVTKEGEQDHYAHSLLYAKVARDMAAEQYQGDSTIAALPMLAKVRLK